VVALGRSTYREHFGSLWSPGGLDRHLAREFDPAAVGAELGSPGVLYLLGEAQGARGFAKVRWDREIPVVGGRGAELQKIYVHGTRAALGTALLLSVLEEAEAAGESRVWLDVFGTNAGAQRLYRRHGFEVRAELPFSTDLAAPGLLVMVR